MRNKIETISTQIRLPATIHNYIEQEAQKVGISRNSFLVVLLEQGKKLWEADVIHQREVK